jgi:Imidazolonepropionase and related amidohydrolases
VLARIVAKAHENRLRVSTHVATATDFHHAVSAGVDEIAHLPSVGSPIAAADAERAAQKKIVVDTTALNSVPSLIRSKVVTETQVRETASANFKLLLKAGVTLAIGSDNGNDTSIEEVEFLHSLNVIDNLRLLRM